MPYELFDDASKIDIDAVHRYLSEESYWAKGRPRELVAKSIENSYCVGARNERGDFAAFARVVTDWTTVYYVCDLFVLPPHRGNGLGKALVDWIVGRPEFSTARGMLLTADAHTLYTRFGFTQDEETQQRFMIRRRPQYTAPQ